MAVVIGLDLGNFNSYPSYISDLNTKQGRLGGNVVDLLPANMADGVPSVFFYDGNGRFLAGRAAVTGAAKPERNRIRYLKRSLGQPLLIDGKPVVINGKTWLYDDAIREVSQSILREAVKEVQRHCTEKTNLVSLSYPATYSSAQREQLINIVQSATTEDGTPFRVVGTIMEPAAAALDYLIQFRRSKNTTVLVFDLGGGTFDLSLVTCYPGGTRRADGTTAYYDIHFTDGLPNTGGCEFDEVIYSLLLDKLNAFLRKNKLPLTEYLTEKLRQNAEKVKKELSFEPYRTVYELFIPALEEEVSLELTREEFEKAPRVVEMLRQMTDKARDILNSKDAPRPEVIVLTGGSCRMPMIREALAKALPDYAASIDSIQEYRPETAISYGAARYGIPEKKSGIVGDTDVIKRLPYEIGIRYLRNDSDINYINTFLQRGTELPCTTDWIGGYLKEESAYQSYRLYEANTPTPDCEQIERDYHFIKTVTVEFGRTMEAQTRSEVRLILDKNGLVTMEARIDENSERFSVAAQLESLK